MSCCLRNHQHSWDSDSGFLPLSLLCDKQQLLSNRRSSLLSLEHSGWLLPPYLLWGLHLDLGISPGCSSYDPTPVYADASGEIILSTSESQVEAGLVETQAFGYPLSVQHGSHICMGGFGQGGPKVPHQALTWTLCGKLKKLVLRPSQKARGASSWFILLPFTSSLWFLITSISGWIWETEPTSTELATFDVTVLRREGTDGTKVVIAQIYNSFPVAAGTKEMLMQ